jgi:hypothetical protein
MGFDYIGAKEAGYTNDEISVHLKGQGIGFNVGGASKAGYDDNEINTYINQKFAALKDSNAPHKKNLLETTDFSKAPQYSLPQNSSEDSHTSSNKVKIDVKKGKVSTAPIVNKSALSDEDIGVVPTAIEASKIVGYNLAKHGAAFNNLIGDKEQEALRRGEMKEFEKSSSILSSDDEATKMVAKMGLDPLTYTPVGIFNKGKKAWDIAKSTLAGGTIGAGLTAEEQLGTTGKVDMKSMGLGAGLGASINALLSTFTHGKVHGAFPVNNVDNVVDDISKVQSPEVIAKDKSIAEAINKEYAPAHADTSRTIIPKEEFDAQEAHKADVEAINANPRLQELIDMRREVSAKESLSPNIRESDRQILHENHGDGYETTVIPTQDTKNYNHDFSLTQADIKAYDKNGITPALAEKFKKDLDVLDNDPLWQKVDENPPADFTVDKDGNLLDIDGNQIFARGADNLLAGTIAGVDEDENGNITFDPEKFVIGLGGYTAVKALAKNPTVQKELREYAQRALNELDTKPHAQYLTGEQRMAPFGKDALIEDLTGIPQELEKFGKNYAKYKSDPKGAINHLMNVQRGQVRGALYHPEIGEIDIVWGKVTDPIGHKGYGLAHIIDKHGEEIGQQLDDIVMGGKVFKKYGNRVWLKNDELNVIVGLDYLGKEKQWVVTSFDPPHQTLADDADLSHESYSLSREGNVGGKGTLSENTASIDDVAQSSNTKSLLQNSDDVKNGNPNTLHARGADNLLAGAYAGIEEDEKGNITFDPEKFVIGLGGYTALKAFVKNPTVQREAKEYVIRALNELDKKSYARALTGEMNIIENTPMKNAPQSAGGFYSVAQEAIDKMPNRMNVAAFRNYLKGRGVKNDEMVYGQIEKALEGKEVITKEEILKAFENPVLEKKVLGEVKSPIVKEYDGNTKYQQYTLKDIGENYREELTTLKGEKVDYKSSHWDESNVLYHARKQDTTINGEKTLLIEELQSDMMQSLRKHRAEYEQNFESVVENMKKKGVLEVICD